ncbi:hypothetical protein PCA31118_04309 [Pandoraea captiosa]|uniref:Uncharacterized protein n=1 Tax=Pandoraea captiosa TaxID=2508302 RepID=A0A5E5AIV9_9BURK|nr:hypothetical protein [Pandoraea captiosa]VVE72772.1 hypothetical protein PCA31118_04309 [Pandoraea captiosa]
MKELLDDAQMKQNLMLILNEMADQPDVARYFPPTMLPYTELMAQIREFVELAGEYSLAYEYIVGALETSPFRVSGEAAIKLLEVGLLMGAKSE